MRRTAILFFLLLVALLRFHEIPLHWAGSALQAPDDRSDVPADIAVLLLGDLIGRGDRAVQVIRAGQAPRVFWGRTESGDPEKRGFYKNEADYVEALLMDGGLTIEQMVKEDSCRNGSTIDEARCFYDYFEKHPPFPKKVVIVTSWYHSRRARWIFRHIFAETATVFTVLSAADPEADASNWWKREDTAFGVINEYIKWAYYLKTY